MHFNCTIWAILVWNSSKCENSCFLLIFTITLKHCLKISLYFYEHNFWKILCKLLKCKSWWFSQCCIIIFLAFFLFLLLIFFYYLLLNWLYVSFFSWHFIHLINFWHNTAFQKGRKYNLHILLNFLYSDFVLLLITHFILYNSSPKFTCC